MAKHPRLTRRDAVYYFRAKVPLDLLEEYAPKLEVKFSLRTKDPEQALILVRIESVKFDQELGRRRRLQAVQPQAHMGDAQLAQLTDLYIRERLQEDEDNRLEPSGEGAFYEATRQALAASGMGFAAGFAREQVTALAGMSDREYLQDGEGIAIAGAAAKEALARGDISSAEEGIEMVTGISGIKVTPGSEPYRKLAAGMLRAEVRVYDLLAQRHRGDVVETPRAPGTLPAVGATDDTAVPFSVLWTRYKTEKQLIPKTASDFGTQANRFIQVVGDLPVVEIKKAHVRAFKDAMLRMPSRIRQDQRHLTVPQLLDAVGADKDIARLSVQTVNDKALGAISAILGYAVANGYREDNPATGLKATGPTSNEPKRLPYSVDDLRVIFGSPVYVSGDRPQGGGGEAAKWLPLLALFTGARLEELGRLEVADIGQEADVHFLFIRPGDNGRRVKSRSGRRRVPIHPELIRLGFLAYVDGRRRAQGLALFPALKSQRGEVTAAFSSWWGRYSGRHGIADPRKVFHSFRHTTKRGLRDAGVDKTLRDALQGHAIKDVAEAYGLDEEGLGISLPALDQAMRKLTFAGLVLDHLVPGTKPVTT